MRLVQTSRKLWSCLCGTAIYFFNDMKDSNVSAGEKVQTCNANTSSQRWLIKNIYSTCVCLCVFFFPQYVEKLELSQMISVTDDNSQDINLNAARFTLSGEDGIIKFTVRDLSRSMQENPLSLNWHQTFTLVLGSFFYPGPQCRSPRAVERLYPLCDSGLWRSTFISFITSRKIICHFYNATKWHKKKQKQT